MGWCVHGLLLLPGAPEIPEVREGRGDPDPAHDFDKQEKWKLRAFASSEVLRKYLESDELIEGVVKQVEAYARLADQKKDKRKDMKFGGGGQLRLAGEMVHGLLDEHSL